MYQNYITCCISLAYVYKDTCSEAMSEHQLCCLYQGIFKWLIWEHINGILMIACGCRKLYSIYYL